MDDSSREEKLKKHAEFQKKLSKMFEDTGIKEVPKEEASEDQYTISFSNQWSPNKLRVNRLTLSKEEIAWLRENKKNSWRPPD